MFKFILLTLLTVNAFAGGGGCDGECDTPPNKIQATCTLENLHEAQLPEGKHSSFELARDEVKKFASAPVLYLGGGVHHKGEPRKLYYASNYLSSGAVFESFSMWSEKDPAITLGPLTIPGTMLFRTLTSGYGPSDLPIVQRAFFRVQKAANSELATFSLTLNVMTSMMDSHEVTALTGDLRCH